MRSTTATRLYAVGTDGRGNESVTATRQSIPARIHAERGDRWKKSNRQETQQRWNYLPVRYFLKRSECEPVSIRVSVKISFSMR